MSTAPTHEPPSSPVIFNRMSSGSPHNGTTSAPVNEVISPRRQSPVSREFVQHSSASINIIPSAASPYFQSPNASVRPRSHPQETGVMLSPRSPHFPASGRTASSVARGRMFYADASVVLAKAKTKSAQRINDSMVYLDGPQVYTCAQCRTHLTSHDDIISKSFHGRHGRAYLFDQCVNVTLGPSEDRRLITGLHSVCDIHCKRCESMVGWTYLRAYETSQKYKEGKYIIEKINLHMEESDYYDVSHPAGERSDRWRLRSMSWGSESSGLSATHSSGLDLVYEYRPSSANASTAPSSPRYWELSGVTSSPGVQPRFSASSTRQSEPPPPPLL